MSPKKTKTPVAQSAKLLPAPSFKHSGFKIGMLAFLLRLKHPGTAIHLLAIAAVVYLLFSTAFTASFFWPRTVAFSFAGDNCLTSPTLLPGLITKEQSSNFTATPRQTVAIAGYPIYSHTTCISPTQGPQEKSLESISFKPLGITFLQKRISVSTGNLPTVAHQAVLSAPIATKDPMVFPLSQQDRVFDYRLTANGQTASCTTNEQSIVCDPLPLKLEQSTGYTLAMQRLFNGKVSQTLFEQSVATVGAVQLAGSSVAAGQTIFDTPSQLNLTFNKEVRNFSGVELSLVSDEGRQAVPITTSAEGAVLTIAFDQALTRSASFELTVGAVSAPDGGHLPAPLVLPFAISGGPKVKGVNIGSYKVSTTGNIVLTFDSTVSTSQNLAEFIKFELGGVSASITASGNRVTINPTETLPACARFKVSVLNGLQNEHGIAGGSAWTYNSRTICQATFSIGTSVQGRGITAYRFGNGGSLVVFVGGTHGNEKSSVYTLNSWLDYLERNYDQIPANRTIVVIPNLNPDGYAKNQRTNHNNVDLNRNFPANNWKQGVTMPGGAFNPNGGGNAPLSEPESKALANYVLDSNPRLVLTYHAAAGIVMPNDSGDSDSLAKIYDQKSNLGYEPSSQTGAIFTYDTTGSFEEWLYDKHTVPVLLIELWTKTANEFPKNQNAMWHMTTLP